MDGVERPRKAVEPICVRVCERVTDRASARVTIDFDLFDRRLPRRRDLENDARERVGGERCCGSGGAGTGGALGEVRRSSVALPGVRV